MPNEITFCDGQTSQYCRVFRVRTVDLKTGKFIVIVNKNDARDFGILPADRIELRNPKLGKAVFAVVDVTDSMIAENEIGIFKDIQTLLEVGENDQIEVRVSARPKSTDFIKKKMDGQKLSFDEIKMIVDDIASNNLSEVEATAFVSSVYMRGLDLDETVSMTKALIGNGKRLDFGSVKVVDKHSVGGLNGRATMILVPIIAAAGYIMPKTSSRSITSSAGTADAMEVLANVSLTLDQIKTVVTRTGACIAWGGAVELAPADDKIIKIEYPLSLDPEGQVIASVMAKKASVGAKYVVIDIPLGPFAKVKSRDKAEQMAMKFVEVGRSLGMKVEVLLTNGTDPSGPAFGPALEAKYALRVLEGKEFGNLAQKALELSGALLELAGDVPKGKGYEKAQDILQSGKALEKMKQIISAQGGKIYSSEDIKEAKFKKQVLSGYKGEVSLLNVELLNKIARSAGAPGTQTAGIMLFVETGSKVAEGQPLFEIYAENERKLQAAYDIATSSDVVEFEQVILEKFV